MESEWYSLAALRDIRELTGCVVFAQQEYFVVAINPTGSTGFGQGICSPEFTPNRWVVDTVRFPGLTDAIAKDWGGKPFVDLRKGWQYILDNYPQVGTPRLPQPHGVLTQVLQIDKDRAVAAGASYGGYAIKCVFALISRDHS